MSKCEFCYEFRDDEEFTGYDHLPPFNAMSPNDNAELVLPTDQTVSAFVQRTRFAVHNSPSDNMLDKASPCLNHAHPVDLLLKMCCGLEGSSIEGPRIAPQEALSDSTITSSLRESHGSRTCDMNQHTLSMGDNKEGNTLQRRDIWVAQDYKDLEEFATIERDTGGSKRRRRIPDIHNQKERVWRERINERIRILHTLIPNSCKGDKVCMLEDAIQYIKSLQQQVQAISEWRRIHKSSSSASTLQQLGTEESLQSSHMGQNICGEPFGYGSMHDMICNCSLSLQMFLPQSFASGSASSTGVTLQPLPVSICPSTHSSMSMNTDNLLYPPHLCNQNTSTGGEL